ncbi:Hypothetical predicted protein [Octopus vulgaris]|uniref:Uncharacterized protein n=1 Tax=Octopus vulgaris TaxID=6645 RepID=A0AA36BTX0_OCTVU|nr:Hypothetical predicted protein [Octopus vulgaris]
MYGIKFPNSWRLGLILVMVLVVQLEAVFGVLLCSRCDSRKDSFYKECEQTPPAPSPCPQHSHSLYCSIVRETDPNGGIMVIMNMTRINQWKHEDLEETTRIYMETDQ